MGEERTIETTGETVDEAVAKAKTELGLGPNDTFFVDVIEEPSRGVFGIGARPARVRLQAIIRREPPPKPAAAAKPAPAATHERTDRGERTERSGSERREPRGERRSDRPARPERTERRDGAPKERSYPRVEDMDDDDSDLVALGGAVEVPEGDPIDDDARVGKAILESLLLKMEVESHITIRRAPASKAGENVPWLLDVDGPEDTSVLIGRRGETLAALQYITRLIASRELQRRANIIVDVGGYKSRRATRLQQLAMRMAEQAMERNRVVTLEPMPPHERRIIHLALRNHPDVQTRSVGDGEARKVTIVPKSMA
ncbi:MAG: Jag N-terminal domain-containing protein [Burkholderiales bacterium]|nr:Jag N-terminal domain-containing protein [Anaerolineae bacterium]